MPLLGHVLLPAGESAVPTLSVPLLQVPASPCSPVIEDLPSTKRIEQVETKVISEGGKKLCLRNIRVCERQKARVDDE